EDLAAAVKLALNGVANDPLVVLRDDGLDGQAIVGRSLDGAHVARAGERQVKRAGNGSGAESEDVHEAAEQLEFFLVHDPKALLLINDDQTEIFEADVVLQQAVSSDDDVHRARGEV